MQERDGEEYLRRWPESRRYPESDQNSAAGGAETSLHHSPCGHDPCPHTPLCMDRDDHPLPPPPLDDGITWFLPFAISALLVVLLLFAFGSHMYGGHKNLVTIEQCAEACDTAKTQTYGMVDLQIDTLVDWLGEIDDSYYAEKRGRALLLSASQSDNLMIGVYDQYHRNKYDDAALFYVFAALNGYQEADGLLRGLSLTLEQSNDVKNRLIDVHQMNGGAGFLKLGQISLDESFQKPGPAAVADRFYYRYSAYLPTRSNSQAFIYFQLAASCGYGEAYDWLTYMAPIDGLSPEYKDELRQNAGDALANLLDQYNVDKAEFCSGEYARRTIQARMPEPNRGGSGRPGELQIYSADGSKAFRDNPGGSSGQPGSVKQAPLFPDFEPVVFIRALADITEEPAHFGPFPEVGHIDSEISVVSRFQQASLAAGGCADIFDLKKRAGLFGQIVARSVHLVLVDVEAAHHDGGAAGTVFNFLKRIGVR